MNPVRFRCRQDYILVKPFDRKQSDVLQVVSYEKHNRGEVVAVGPGKDNKRGIPQPLDAKVGDLVLFGDGSKALDNCYPKVELEGVEYRLIQEADICAIVEPAEAA